MRKSFLFLFIIYKNVIDSFPFCLFCVRFFADDRKRKGQRTKIPKIFIEVLYRSRCMTSSSQTSWPIPATVWLIYFMRWWTLNCEFRTLELSGKFKILVLTLCMFVSKCLIKRQTNTIMLPLCFFIMALWMCTLHYIKLNKL